MHLSYELDDIDSEDGNRGHTISGSLAGFSVENRNGELVIPVAEDRFGDALFNFVQALTRSLMSRFFHANAYVQRSLRISGYFSKKECQRIVSSLIGLTRRTIHIINIRSTRESMACGGRFYICLTERR